MKKIAIVILVIAFLPFSACVKSVEEEGVSPDFIPHFSYGGYTYYIHPALGVMNWEDANNACKELTAYGYKDWFLPSMGEFDAARSAGYFWSDIWSSTPSSSDDWYYVFRNDSYYSKEWVSYRSSNMFKVIPMRKQAAMTSK